MGKNYDLLHKNTPNGFFHTHWECSIRTRRPILYLVESLEALTVNTHHRAHCNKGVLVDVVYNFQDTRCVTLTAYHHHNFAIGFGVPALTVDDCSATMCFVDNGVSYLLKVRRDDKYLA